MSIMVQQEKNPLPLTPSSKKIWEIPVIGPILISVAVLLLAAFLIWGIRSLLTSQKDHHDLIRELESKTFGNRWVAALELSKLLAQSKIPKQDIPWLTSKLNELYDRSIATQDQRTRHFIMAAVGLIPSVSALNIISKGLNDDDSEVQFRSLVSLSQFPQSTLKGFNWNITYKYLENANNDPKMAQILILTLAHLNFKNFNQNIIKILQTTTDLNLQYSAALALIADKNELVIPIVQDILKLSPAAVQSTGIPESESVKMNKQWQINMLRILQKHPWPIFRPELEALSKSSPYLEIKDASRNILEVWSRHE